MRLRSTGLGNTELEAHITAIKKVDDLVFFCADVSKPVKWHTRMAFQEKDMRVLILALLKGKNLVFICKALLFGRREVPRTEDF
jgi:hypothetical protein